MKSLGVEERNISILDVTLLVSIHEDHRTFDGLNTSCVNVTRTINDYFFMFEELKGHGVIIGNKISKNMNNLLFENCSSSVIGSGEDIADTMDYFNTDIHLMIINEMEEWFIN